LVRSHRPLLASARRPIISARHQPCGRRIPGSAARNLPDSEALRSDYVAGLRRYNGVTYFWGGEELPGHRLLGLIRRGLIDSLFCRGIRTFDPGLVRRALDLWWHDCTAEVLGEATR